MMPQETDVLIIGSGIAGLATAIMLSEGDNPPHVTVITKGKLKQSNTYWAQGGVAAVMGKEDSFQDHITDTMKAGSEHNDPRAVRHLVEGAPKAFRFLRSLGVNFEEEPVLEAAHGRPRVYRTSDFTGQDILNQLVKAVKRAKNVTLLEDTDAARLIEVDGECFGAFVRSTSDSKMESRGGVPTLRPLRAKNTVLATGGCGQLFAKTTNTLGSGGDGLALATLAGLDLADLEFMQFHPTAFAQPDDGRYFLLSEALRGFGAHLVSQRGERFLSRFDKRGELAPRDILARIVYFELIHGPVYLDMRHLGLAPIKKTFPNIFRRIKQYGLDMSKDLMPVTPAAHYMCGGVPTDLHGATKMPGLFAVGEVARTGAHGANRLASNSLLEAIVFARDVTETMEKGRPLDDVKNIPAPTKVPEVIMEDIAQVKAYSRRLGQIMWEHVGPMRTVEGLERGKQEIARLPARDYRIQHRQIVCHKIIEACLARPQSLGCHYMTQPPV